MNFVPVSSAVYLCGMMIFSVSGAPSSIKCQKPADLKVHYETVAAAAMGKKFLLPAEYITPPVNVPPNEGETTCPNALPVSGETRDRSTCPWYTKVVTDYYLFPSVRMEAICRCADCIGSNGMHNCEIVYTAMLFLNYTSVCVDGLFVYKPETIFVPTGCVCAQKRATLNPTDYESLA